MELTSILHVLVEEASSIASSTQECLLSSAGCLVGRRSLLAKCGTYWCLACLSRELGGLSLELLVCLLQLGELRVLRLVCSEHLLQVVLLDVVLDGLLLDVIGESLQGLLKFLNFVLLVVEALHLDLISLVFGNIGWLHLPDFQLQLLQLGLLEANCLALVSFLLLEVNTLLLRQFWLLPRHLLLCWLSARAPWHRWVLDELVVDRLDHLAKR